METFGGSIQIMAANTNWTFTDLSFWGTNILSRLMRLFREKAGKSILFTPEAEQINEAQILLRFPMVISTIGQTFWFENCSLEFIRTGITIIVS